MSEIFLAKVPETVTVAFAVLADKYGAGTARKVALESAGYNYDKVQGCVNDLLALFEKYREGD